MKRRDMRGFTLIEMLIVVGIIAVLVSVSIPMVNSSLERARIATDMANERAARAAALVKYLEDDLDDDDSRIFSYDAATGTLSSFDLAPCVPCRVRGLTHRAQIVDTILKEE